MSFLPQKSVQPAKPKPTTKQLGDAAEAEEEAEEERRLGLVDAEDLVVVKGARKEALRPEEAALAHAELVEAEGAGVVRELAAQQGLVAPWLMEG